MNKDELNRLLDSVYELEGLIHLALAREDCPEVVPGLILRKAESLPKLAASIIGRRDNQPMQETVTVGIIADEPEYQDPVEMVDDNAVDGNAVDGNAVDDEEDMPECLSMSECLAVTDDFEDDPVAAATDDEPAAIEPEKEDSVVAIPESPAVPAAQAMPEVPSKGAVRVPRGRLVFTINDRFRFKRELFNNSDINFNETLARVASMEGYEEAEDYFVDELQWDLERQDVADFLEILKNYFK